MTAPALARLAADLDAACETSRELTALWDQVVDAYRKARAGAARGPAHNQPANEES